MIDYTVVSAHRDLLGEVPIWCERTASLWWIDVLRSALHHLDTATGQITTATTQGGRIGSIALREQGGLLVANSEGIDFFDPGTGTQQPFAGYGRLGPAQRFNDGRVDRQGRFWVGSMHEEFLPQGTLFRVDTDGTITAIFGDIIVPNGIAFSPDSRTLYFADTRRFSMWSFDFDAATGMISNRTAFSDTKGKPGRPDGSAVDSEGFIWNAEYAGGQIVRYAPNGRIDRTIDLPMSHPTSLCFGGPDLQTLFITSGSYTLSPDALAAEPLAGAVIAIHAGVKGLPEPRFGG